MTIKEAVIEVLESSQGPLDVHVITKRMLEQNLWSSSGKTPASTVAARLYTEFIIQTNALVACIDNDIDF